MQTAITTDRVKIQIPAHVAEHMRSWRAHGCWGAPPQSFIEFHKALALTALDALEKDFIVHKNWVADDGWMDRMVVVWAILEHKKTGKLVKIHWHDSNQEFFASHESGGSSPLSFRSFV